MTILSFGEILLYIMVKTGFPQLSVHLSTICPNVLWYIWDSWLGETYAYKKRVGIAKLLSTRGYFILNLNSM